ncbi:MAG: glycosyltransferase [Candidatus Babeliales bacterium]
MKKNSPLKIIFITNNYTPYSGGVVSSIDSFSQELRASGHEVYIITFDFDEQVSANDAAHVFRIKTILKFQYLQKHMAIPWMASKAMTDIIRRINPDCIHLHHPFLLGKSGLKIARAENIPVIFTYHTLYDQYTHYLPLMGAMAWVKEIVRNQSIEFCNKVDHVIAPSETIKQYLKNHNVTKPISVVPSGILPIYINTTMPSKNLSFAAATHTTQPTIKLLTVCRFNTEKNIPFLLDVAHDIAQKFSLSYTLIGYGDELDMLQQYAYKKCGLTKEQVHFIIKPPKAIIAQAYQQADLFLYASQSETQGIVIAEAMAAGTPVIALEGPGIQDIIINGHNGYLIKNRQEMAHAIPSTLADPIQYQTLCKGAFATGQRYFPQECAKRLHAIYTSV